MQTAAGNAQTLEDEANADIADTAADDAFGMPSCHSLFAFAVFAALTSVLALHWHDFCLG